MVSAVKHLTLRVVISALIVVWLCILMAQPSPLLLISEFGLFSALGVIGAIFANSTGAGAALSLCRFSII